MTDPVTIYLHPSTGWMSDGARFAAYFFGNGEVWVDMTDADGDGNYECKLPAGGYTNVIFTRMNPEFTDNNWNNDTEKRVWNQTPDLDVPTGNSVCFVVNPDKWNPEDSDFGYWTSYPPVIEEQPDNGGNSGNTGDTSNMIYLDPWQWTSDGARIEAYFFGGANDVWATMTLNNGLYECSVPEGQTNVIFVRMNPANSNNDWNNKWNQTEDLAIPTDGQNKFTINSWEGGADGKSAGVWSTK